MPMFYTPKPRQFHYSPRLYDPEKEEWEKLKAKYRLKNGIHLDDNLLNSNNESNNNAINEESVDSELAYFQRRVKDIDRSERQRKNKLTLSDLFVKREKPEFHYVSRFDNEGNLVDSTTHLSEKAVQHKISRRFDNDDMDRFKPIPASKIILYTLGVCILLLFIFS